MYYNTDNNQMINRVFTIFTHNMKSGKQDQVYHTCENLTKIALCL